MEKLSTFVLLVVAAVVLAGIIRLAFSDLSYLFLAVALASAGFYAYHLLHPKKIQANRQQR